MNKDIRDIREFREIKEVKDIGEISAIRAISAISDISEDVIGLGFVVSLWLTSPKVRMSRSEGVSVYHNRTYA